MGEEKTKSICVIKIDADENGWHDLCASNSWGDNPYGEEYAIVPEGMVGAIKETFGYCDITLNKERTEVVSFVAREIPDFPESEPEEPTGDDVSWDAMAKAIEEGVNDV